MKLPDNENLTAVRERILPVLKKYRAVLAVSVYAVNTRQTSGSDSRSRESDVSVVSNGSCGETPVTVKRVLPVFRGAVVLCDGADDASVRLSVTQAVSTVCGIGADKVTVLKMQSDT